MSIETLAALITVGTFLFTVFRKVSPLLSRIFRHWLTYLSKGTGEDTEDAEATANHLKDSPENCDKR